MKTAKYFSATWCGPCKVFKPTMKELSDEGYDIEFLDGDENPKLASEYNIRSVPTTVIEVDGKEIVEADWFDLDNLPNTPPNSTLSGRLINSCTLDH